MSFLIANEDIFNAIVIVKDTFFGKKNLNNELTDYFVYKFKEKDRANIIINIGFSGKF